MVLAILAAAQNAPAADVTPFLKGERLGLTISSIQLPESLPKDLVSGLSNNLLIRVALYAGIRELAQATATVVVKYDLWEETFRVTLLVNEVPVEMRSVRAVQEVQTFLSELNLPDMFALRSIPPDGSGYLRIEMLFNPIQRQRLDAIRKWVAANSTSTPGSNPGFSEKQAANSTSSAIFNRIFEQYAQGADVAASWKETIVSKPIKIEHLER